MKNVFFLISLLLLALLLACHEKSAQKKEQIGSQDEEASLEHEGVYVPEKIFKTDEEWRQLLTPQQHVITRKKGTERPYTGKYFNFTREGTYQCVCCANDLFSSETKFDSGTGWPSFWAPISHQNIKTLKDGDLRRQPLEVMCNRCDAHLGHVFDDGPPPTGLRYSINSVALQFIEKE